MASNSRVRAVRARQLGWKPKARSLIEEIEQGCYRRQTRGPGMDTQDVPLLTPSHHAQVPDISR